MYLGTLCSPLSDKSSCCTSEYGRMRTSRTNHGSNLQAKGNDHRVYVSTRCIGECGHVHKALQYDHNEPTLPSNRSTLRCNMKPIFCISTTYSVMAAKDIAFQHRLPTGITPHELIEIGSTTKPALLYMWDRCPAEGHPGIPTGVLWKVHKENCLWQDINHSL